MYSRLDLVYQFDVDYKQMTVTHVYCCLPIVFMMKIGNESVE